jgi:hypothetical protein
MITFKEYLEEVTAQDEFSRLINDIPHHKRESFRKTYDGLRKKGFAGRAAITQAYTLHKEETE